MAPLLLPETIIELTQSQRTAVIQGAQDIAQFVKEVSESYQLGDDKFLDITKSNLYDPLGLITPLEPDEDLSNGASATKKRKLGEDLPPLQRNTHPIQVQITVVEPFKYLLKSVNKMLHFNTALTGLYTITAKSVKSAGKLTTSARAVSPFDVRDELEIVLDDCNKAHTALHRMLKIPSQHYETRAQLVKTIREDDHSNEAKAALTFFDYQSVENIRMAVFDLKNIGITLLQTVEKYDSLV